MSGPGEPLAPLPGGLLLRPKVQSVLSQATYVVSIAALNVVVVRAWGAQERGELATITVVATIVATAAGLGISDVLVWRRGRPLPQPDVSPRFRRSLLLTAASGLCASAVVALAFDEPTGWLIAPWVVTLHLFRCTMSVRLGAGDFGRFNLGRTVMPLLSSALVAIGAIWAAVHPAMLVVAGQIMAVAALGRRESADLRVRGRLRGSAPGEASVARHSVVGNLAGISLARVDVLLVAWLLGADEAGVYAVALAVGDGAMVASYGLMFHAMHEGATERRVSRRTLVASVGASASLSALAIAGLWIAGERVLGPEFSGIALTFALLAPGIVAMGFVRLRYAADLTGGIGGAATASLLAALVVLILLDLALVPTVGINGAAIASSMAYLFASGLIVRRRTAAASVVVDG